MSNMDSAGNRFAPLLYLITDGTTTDTDCLARLLPLIEAAVEARLPLLQIREKSLTPRVLYELTCRAAALTRGSATRLLVNDRADIARAAGADGVHLTTQSLDAAIVRRLAGSDFLLGVSAHSLAEAVAARDGGAHFATFGPVFDTPSKRAYGPPLGLAALRETVRALAPWPVLALGGINQANAPAVWQTGAAGLSAIRLFAGLGTEQTAFSGRGLFPENYRSGY